MWSVILAIAFPVTEGYINAPQHEVAKRFTDFTTMRWQRNAHDKPYKREFLITETKKAIIPTPESHWRDAEGQLKGYLDRCYREEGGTDILYGIVAIGRWAKFYVYEGQSGELELMDDEEEPFHVMKNADVIIDRLERIKRAQEQ